MKVFLAIFCIALVLQGSVAERVEKDSYQVMKEMAAEMKQMIQAVIKDMPTTVAYRKHKQDWNNVLRMYDERKDGENCVDKINRIIQAFGNVITTYMKRTTTAEEKEMLQLFNQHGFAYITDKYGQMLKKAKNPENDIVERC